MGKKEPAADITLFTIFLRFVGGFGAGLAGTIVLGIILFLTWSIIGETISQADVNKSEFGVELNEQNTHPLFMGVILVAVFLASLVSNLIYCILSTTLEEKYQARSTNLTQIFSGNLCILVFLIPLYLISTKSNGVNGVTIVAVAHILLTTIFTFFILEIFSTSTYIIVSLYGLILGLILFLLFEILLAGNTTIILSFSILPLLLASLGAGNGIVEMFYYWLQKAYGMDFLDVDRRFGNDYGKKEKIIDDDFEDL